MDVDIGPALAEVVTPGVPRGALDRLDERVGRAHERIEEGRAAGEHGYAALELPETVDLAEMEAVIEGLPSAQEVILVGIGGSALGAAAIADALGTRDRLHVLDNVDPRGVSDALATATFEDAIVHVVSRSGTTTETLANFGVVRTAMAEAGVDWRDRTLITTGADGPLRELADREGLPALPVPTGVPGRYAALSTVGLPSAALLGHDVEALLDGGRDAVDGLTASLYGSPAYAFGATSYALAARGATVSAMMPYADGLETFAEWFAQLWAESLGKDGLGQVPARALGVTDQHSQLQLYRGGPRTIQVNLLGVAEGPDRDVPAGAVPGVGETSLRTIMDAERRATAASLAAAGRPSLRLELARLDERALGELLVSMEAACMLAGTLLGVDPFDQPAVEWGKRATNDLLTGAEPPDSFEAAPALRVSSSE